MGSEDHQIRLNFASIQYLRCKIAVIIAYIPYSTDTVTVASERVTQ
jgi:hypothetical protein